MRVRRTSPFSPGLGPPARGPFIFAIPKEKTAPGRSRGRVRDSREWRSGAGLGLEPLQRQRAAVAGGVEGADVLAEPGPAAAALSALLAGHVEACRRGGSLLLQRAGQL